MSVSKSQVCYVLTSNGVDSHADVNLISIWSLRLSNPWVSVRLLCDDDTTSELEQCRHPILENVDDVVSITTPAGNGGYRNRYVKTSMRRYINGSFLYLDADTLIRRSLTPIFATQAPLSAAPNHSGSGSPLEAPANEVEVYERVGWGFPRQLYVNGGVLFFSDHPDTDEFFEEWHRRWLAFVAATGDYHDQFSLNSALNETHIEFAWMDARYNAQIHARPCTAWDGVVWHVYRSGHPATPRTVVEHGLRQLRDNPSVIPGVISDLHRRLHPWLIDNPVDWLAVRSLQKDKGMLTNTHWEHAWLSDQYGISFWLMGRRIVQLVYRWLCRFDIPKKLLKSLRRAIP